MKGEDLFCYSCHNNVFCHGQTRRAQYKEQNKTQSDKTAYRIKYAGSEPHCTEVSHQTGVNQEAKSNSTWLRNVSED